MIVDWIEFKNYLYEGRYRRHGDYIDLVFKTDQEHITINTIIKDLRFQLDTSKIVSGAPYDNTISMYLIDMITVEKQYSNIWEYIKLKIKGEPLEITKVTRVSNAYNDFELPDWDLHPEFLNRMGQASFPIILKGE